MLLRFTEEEASIYLSMRVAFGDGKFVPEEKEMIGGFYDMHSVEKTVAKHHAIGKSEKADANAIEVLKGTSMDFQLRSLAIGLAVSASDGYIDIRETDILAEYASRLGYSVDNVVKYFDDKLKAK